MMRAVSDVPPEAVVLGPLPAGPLMLTVPGSLDPDEAGQLASMVANEFDRKVLVVLDGIAVEAAGLTIRRIAEVNRERCKRWHPADSEPWTGADWSNAMCGEAGEAANIVKKLRRDQTRAANAGDPPCDVLVKKLGHEIADVLLYALLLADHYGIDVEAAVVDKFNRVSERQGFPERLP